MLYDPKWEQQTKADPFTLERLIAWLEQRDPAERYDFCEWNQCLFGQWMRSIDPSARAANPNKSPGLTGFHYHALGRVVDVTPFKEVAGIYYQKKSLTFGAALDRARAALAAG